MTKQWPDSVLLEELGELTVAFRTDPYFEFLRELLASQDVMPDRCMLAGFMESEEGEEWGLVVRPDFTSFEYHRDNEAEESSEIEILREFDDPEEAAKFFPAARVVAQFG